MNIYLKMALNETIDFFGSQKVDIKLHDRLENITKLEIPVNSKVLFSINENHEVEPHLTTSYGRSLLNLTDSNSLVSRLSEADTKVETIDSLTGRIEFTTDNSLRMKIENSTTEIENEFIMKNERSHKRITNMNAYPLLQSIGGDFQANVYGPSVGKGILLERGNTNGSPIYKINAYENAPRDLETNSSFSFFGTNHSPISLHRGTGPISAVSELDRSQIAFYNTKDTSSHTYGHYITSSHNSDNTSLENNRIDFFTNGGGSNGTLSNAVLGLTIQNGKINTPEIVTNRISSFSNINFSNHISLDSGKSIYTASNNFTTFSDIGSSSNKFNNIYGNAINTNTITFDPALNIFNIGDGTQALLRIDGLQNNSLSCRSIIPFSHNTHDLGTYAVRWTDIYSVNAVTSNSDKRLKKDIKKIDFNCLEIVKQLQPVSFVWKEKGNRPHLGLIAQDTPKKLKEYGYFCDDRNGGFLSLRLQELQPVIIKAIKELNSKIENKTVFVKNIEENKQEKIVENPAEIKIELDNLSFVIHNQTQLFEEKLEKLNKRTISLEETKNILIRENMELKNKIDEREPNQEILEDSEGGVNMIELLQEKLFELEKRLSKTESKNKKLTLALNKLIKNRE